MDEAAYRERTYTSQDGLRLYYRDYGDPLSPATPVLCLGGLTRNSKDFHDLAARLAGRRRVLCPDYRGRGRSDYDADWRHYAASTYLDDIRHLLAASGVHQVAVVGTSLGGLLACAMAVAMPCAIVAAVLNDIGPDIDGTGLDRIIAYIEASPPQADWAAAVGHLKREVPGFPTRHDDDWLAIAKATYRQGDDGRLHVDWDPALAKALRVGTEVDLWAVFRAFGERPVVAVRGALSDILGADTLARMQDTLPGLVAVTVPGVGHAPKLTEPEVTEALDGLFLRIDG